MAEADRQQKEAQEAEQRAHMEKVAGDYYSKVNAVKDKYPDFDAVMGDFNASKFPEIVMLAAGMDNAGDVMYDLAKNPSKLANLTSLHRSGLTDYATQAVKEISDSIKQNQNALQQPKTPEPLNQIKPSNIGLGNSSNRSVADLMRDPSYRG